MAGKPLIEQTSELSQAKRLRSAMGVRKPAAVGCQIDGVRVAWQLVQGPLSRGAHPTIVCLHDLASGSRQYGPLVTRIPAGAQLLLIDWPGHGRSDDLIPVAPNAENPLSVEQYALRLHDIFNQIGLSQIGQQAFLPDRSLILLATGFSGAIAVRYAADHPERVKGVVLCQPGGLVEDHRDRRRQPGNPCLGSTARCFPASIRDLTETSTRWQAMRQQVIAGIHPDLLKEAKDLLRISRQDLLAAARELVCPILFLLSRENSQYPLASYLAILEPLLELPSQHRFTVFAGNFHPLWDEPQRFAQALTAFVHALLPLADHQHAWLLTAVDWPARDLNLWKCVHPDCPRERILATGLDANSESQN